MKNIKKIISLLCVVLFMFSISVFADIEDGEEIIFKLKADNATVKVNENIVLTVYADGKAGSEDLTSLYYDVLYKSEEFTFVASSLGKDSEKNVDGYDKRIYVQKDYDPAETCDYSNLGTVELTAVKAGTYTIKLAEAWLADANWTQSATVEDTITITVEGDEPTVITHEEDFADDVKDLADPAKGDVKEDTYTSASKVSFNGSEIDMAAGSKAYTFFAKAAKDLKANSYGVTVNINGVGYKFPGIADVAEGNAWAIKLVIPEGKFGGDGKAIESVDTFAAYGNN